MVSRELYWYIIWDLEFYRLSLLNLIKLIVYRVIGFDELSATCRMCYLMLQIESVR